MRNALIYKLCLSWIESSGYQEFKQPGSALHPALAGAPLLVLSWYYFSCNITLGEETSSSTQANHLNPHLWPSSSPLSCSPPHWLLRQCNLVYFTYSLPPSPLQGELPHTGPFVCFAHCYPPSTSKNAKPVVDSGYTTGGSASANRSTIPTHSPASVPCPAPIPAPPSSRTKRTAGRRCLQEHPSHACAHGLWQQPTCGGGRTKSCTQGGWQPVAFSPQNPAGARLSVGHAHHALTWRRLVWELHLSACSPRSEVKGVQQLLCVKGIGTNLEAEATAAEVESLVTTRGCSLQSRHLFIWELGGWFN